MNKKSDIYDSFDDENAPVGVPDADDVDADKDDEDEEDEDEEIPDDKDEEVA